MTQFVSFKISKVLIFFMKYQERFHNRSELNLPEKYMLAFSSAPQEDDMWQKSKNTLYIKKKIETNSKS